MNKLFAFLCFNTVAWTAQAEESQDKTSRGINFESWSNFTQNDDEVERAAAQRKNEETEEENEKGDNE